MRGLYTVGALDLLMEKGVSFDYVIGVSAGACNGVSFVSGQKGRNYRVNTEFLDDPRYMGVRSLLKTKSFFGMDFIFHTIPETLIPFDYDAFLKSPTEFVAGVTDVETGKPVYFNKDALDHDCTVLMASSSIPVFSPPVEVRGRLYLDGGAADPIPFRQAFRDGCDRVVVIRTRHRDFRREPESFRHVYRQIFRHTPSMAHALDIRHRVYNQSCDCLDKLEASGKAVIIAPSMPLEIDRFERHKERLEAAARLGARDCSDAILAHPEFFPHSHAKPNAEIKPDTGGNQP